MEQTVISVIVPIYKVEQYLRQCVDSILNQTHSALEVILVDDGSPDAAAKSATNTPPGTVGCG